MVVLASYGRDSGLFEFAVRHKHEIGGICGEVPVRLHVLTESQRGLWPDLTLSGRHLRTSRFRCSTQ